MNENDRISISLDSILMKADKLGSIDFDYDNYLDLKNLLTETGYVLKNSSGFQKNKDCRDLWLTLPTLTDIKNDRIWKRSIVNWITITLVTPVILIIILNVYEFLGFEWVSVAIGCYILITVLLVFMYSRNRKYRKHVFREVEEIKSTVSDILKAIRDPEFLSKKREREEAIIEMKSNA